MKKKLQRFAENETFPHVLQPKLIYPPQDDPIKGRWNDTFFKNENPIVLELGCGRGEYTVNLAEMFPDKNFIGIDRKGARLWRGAKTSHVNGMKNVGFLRIFIQHIQYYFEKDEVSEIWITFPDPQPQQSRERKRLTSPRFLDYYKNILKPNGHIHLKTDNKEFYNYSVDVARQQQYKIHAFTDDLYSNSEVTAKELFSIQTTYEKIFLQKGSTICYLNFSFE